MNSSVYNSFVRPANHELTDCAVSDIPVFAYKPIT